MLREALQGFGPIESIVASEHYQDNLTWYCKFTAHEAAELATIAAPNPDLYKYTFIAYRDCDPYDGRGW